MLKTKYKCNLVLALTDALYFKLLNELLYVANASLIHEILRIFKIVHQFPCYHTRIFHEIIQRIKLPIIKVCYRTMKKKNISHRKYASKAFSQRDIQQ